MLIMLLCLQMWSPFAITHSDDAQMLATERYVYSHEEYISIALSTGYFMTHNYTDESMEEDRRMMAFFDSLVQRQLEGKKLVCKFKY